MEPVITSEQAELLKAVNVLKNKIYMPSVIQFLNDNDVNYYGMSDLEMIEWYLNNGGLMNESAINEDVMIPPDLSNQYLTVKKQMADKQSKKDSLMKAVNQVDNEINILTKNLIAIESKAAQSQEQAQNQQDPNQQNPQGNQKTTVEVEGQVKESLDEQWERYMSEGLDPDEIEDIDDMSGNIDHKVVTNGEEDVDEVEDESLEGDYTFSVKIIMKDEEDIIAKFYKNSDEGPWEARVVQGAEEPLESYEFDQEWDKVTIIEKLPDIVPNNLEVEEILSTDYVDLMDDKEEMDEIYYEDIIKDE